jgi:hypothetical protein
MLQNLSVCDTYTPLLQRTENSIMCHQKRTVVSITEALASTSAAWARRCIVLEPEQPDDSPCNDENGYILPGTTAVQHITNSSYFYAILC